MSLIYVAIAKDSKVLCDYTEYKGNFEQIIHILLKKIEVNSRATIQYESQYNYHYQNVSSITYICMADPSYPTDTAFNFLESVEKEFQSSYGRTDLTLVAEYSLKNTFSEKLKMKIEYYNEHKDYQKGALDRLREGILQTKDQILSSNDLLDERGQKINLIATKSQDLNLGSNLYYKSSQNVKRHEQMKKVKIAVIIIVGLAVVALIITAIACGSGFKKCKK